MLDHGTIFTGTSHHYIKRGAILVLCGHMTSVARRSITRMNTILSASQFEMHHTYMTERMYDGIIVRRIYLCIRDQGIARTQSPTTINYTPEFPTFGGIVRVSPTEVQWKGLALGEPPC